MRDVDTQRLCIVTVGRSPDFAENSPYGYYSIQMLHQASQDVEFGSRDIDLRPGAIDATFWQINAHPTDLDHGLALAPRPPAKLSSPTLAEEIGAFQVLC